MFLISHQKLHCLLNLIKEEGSVKSVWKDWQQDYFMKILAFKEISFNQKNTLIKNNSWLKNILKLYSLLMLDFVVILN